MSACVPTAMTDLYQASDNGQPAQRESPFWVTARRLS